MGVIVHGKCPNCDRIVKVDNTKISSVCTYCGEAIKNFEAINYYEYFGKNNMPESYESQDDDTTE